MRVHYTMRLPAGIADVIERASRRETRTRSGQILHYIRRGMAAEGCLPQLVEAPSDRSDGR